MPFAHCLDCGTSALIDPSGRCPEGHEVGVAGARVAAAIGSSDPHPDEPKPWVGVVDLDPTVIDTTPPEPRVARPPSLPANGQLAPVAEAPAATDDLLRELHALGGLDDVDAPATPPTVAPARAPYRPAAPAPTVAATPPTPVAPPAPVPSPTRLAVTPGSPTPPSSPEEATELDELASLAAVIGSLDEREATAATPATPVAPSTQAPAVDAAAPALSALDELWAAAESATPSAASPTASTPPPATAAPVPTAAPAPATATTVETAPVTAVDAQSPFDGSFTARGDGVGRRTQRRLDAKAAKKGLFRR